MIKKFSKFLIVALTGAGFILLIFPVSWFPKFYDVRYMGWIGVVGATIIFLLPRLIRPKTETPNFDQKNQAVDLFQFLLAIAFMNNALGDLGLYKLYVYGFEFDKVIHFFNPLLAIIAISLVLNKRWGIRKGYSILIASGILLSFGVTWEIYEILADLILKTHIAGNFGLNVSRDTKFDLMFDVLGSTSGALCSIYFWKYFVGELKIKKSQIITTCIVILILTMAIGFLASYAKM